MLGATLQDLVSVLALVVVLSLTAFAHTWAIQSIRDAKTKCLPPHASCGVNHRVPVLGAIPVYIPPRPRWKIRLDDKT